MVGDQSSWTPTIWREIEEVPQDDPKDASSRQGRSDPKESDERLALENLSGPLVERSELSEVSIEWLRDHYHILSWYRLMAPSKEGWVVCPPDGYIAIYKKLLHLGFRFPLHPIFVNIFDLYDVVPA